MRPPAAAIAWELARRHRRFGWALGAWLAVLAAVRVLDPGAAFPPGFDKAERLALYVLVPGTVSFFFLMAAFSFGLDGDIAARESLYPARFFTLPVATDSLSRSPMLCGTAVSLSLWAAVRLVAPWPHRDVPVLWPGLLAASLLAWTQALSWRPYPVRGLRVVVTVLWLMAIEGIAVLAVELRATEPMMLALLLPHLPLADLAARRALARARRGDGTDPRGVPRRRGAVAGAVPRPLAAFRSAARAQLWLEGRRHGRSLPALVAILLPFELALLGVFSGTEPLVFATLVAVLLTPPFAATLVAATAGNRAPGAPEGTGLDPFLATRPLGNASLAGATLLASLASAVATWLLVLPAIAAGTALTGTAPLVLAWFRETAGVLGTPRAVAAALFGLLLLVGSTWKLLVQSHTIGLVGGGRLGKGCAFASLMALVAIGPVVHGLHRNGAFLAALWSALPAILAALAALKIAAGAWIAARLHARRVLRPRTLLLAAAGWDALVLALYGVLAWLLPPLVVRGSVLLCVAVLSVPLVRVSALPLVLARSRHR